jgi:hypothetical protein
MPSPVLDLQLTPKLLHRARAELKPAAALRRAQHGMAITVDDKIVVVGGRRVVMGDSRLPLCRVWFARSVAFGRRR